MKVRVKALIPGHHDDAPIGMEFDAVPATYTPRCFNISNDSLKIIAVPREHLEVLET
jgi:hypothetical protein